MSELNLNKLKLQTANIYEENIKKLKELFPQIVSEDKIDFDILKQLLSNTIVEADDERYRLDWVGKKRSLLKANTPINKTLRPCKNESVDFENTKNLYIEGDNFEVLKLLQESYLNKIKMIYIDPPYNTGKDFVYRDNFTQNKADFEDEIGLRDDEGNKLFKNTDSNGRFHSDWLSMMYERLLIARDLLKDDGVIFISIDDNEVHNLRKICDEVFGEGNFVDIFNWAKTETPANLSKKSKKVIEYILCYEKNENDIKFRGKVKESLSSNGLLNQTNKIGELVFPKNIVITNIDDGIIKKGKYGTESYNIDLLEDTEVKNGLFIKDIYLEAKFKWTQDKLNEEIRRGTIIRIPTIKLSPSYEKNEYEPEVPPNLINSKVDVGTNENAGVHLTKLFGKKIFDFPKPVNLIKYLINFNIEENDICLDFFSGSGTLAESVMEISLKTKIHYICVQIPEELDIKKGKSDAEKEIIKNAIDFLTDNKKPTNICEIGKERIRRAGAKILEDNKDKDLSSLDIGFRVLKVDSSNMKDIYYHPNEIKQNQLKMFETNIKEDRSDLDLLFSIMLDLGITLDLKITTKIIDDKKLYFIENSELIVCFEENITLKIIEAIKEEKPYKIVLKDGCFANDTQKINAILELSLISSISVI